MIDRRNFLTKALAAMFAPQAIAEIAAIKPVPVTMLREAVTPLRYLMSETICLRDARCAYNFKDRVQCVLDHLLKQLPEDQKWEIRWLCIYDKEKNSLSNLGQFVAMPAPANQIETISIYESGFLESLAGKP